LNGTVIFGTVSEDRLKKYHVREDQELKTIESMNDSMNDDADDNEKEEVKFTEIEEEEELNDNAR
jgi:hypothetical protein